MHTHYPFLDVLQLNIFKKDCRLLVGYRSRLQIIRHVYTIVLGLNPGHLRYFLGGILETNKWGLYKM